MNSSEFRIVTDPSPEQIAFLEDRLYEFNVAATGIGTGEHLAIVVRDERDRVVAGICGNTWGGVCEIRQLWVDASRRGTGVGRGLLQAAETEARRLGCAQMVLSTFSFQAPQFYARYGFEVVSIVEDFPLGHRSLLLRKRLSEGAASAN